MDMWTHWYTSEHVPHCARLELLGAQLPMACTRAPSNTVLFQEGIREHAYPTRTRSMRRGLTVATLVSVG